MMSPASPIVSIVRPLSVIIHAAAISDSGMATIAINALRHSYKKDDEHGDNEHGAEQHRQAQVVQRHFDERRGPENP